MAGIAPQKQIVKWHLVYPAGAKVSQFGTENDIVLAPHPNTTHLYEVRHTGFEYSHLEARMGKWSQNQSRWQVA